MSDIPFRMSKKQGFILTNPYVKLYLTTVNPEIHVIFLTN